ncbi:hypothetical protein J6590_026463 [Homalodisca vitripennis]|nr:hypothetical protein J6590_026463 [Homalodisca vitripennis]
MCDELDIYITFQIGFSIRRRGSFTRNEYSYSGKELQRVLPPIPSPSRTEQKGKYPLIFQGKGSVSTALIPGGSAVPYLALNTICFYSRAISADSVNLMRLWSSCGSASHSLRYVEDSHSHVRLFRPSADYKPAGISSSANVPIRAGVTAEC